MIPWYNGRPDPLLNDPQLITPLFLFLCWLFWYGLKKTRERRRNLKLGKALRSAVKTWGPEAQR